MSGDVFQVVHRNAGIGHPGEPGVTQVVSSELFVTECDDDLIPVCCVAKDAGLDSSSLRTREQSSVGFVVHGMNSFDHQIADVLDERNVPSALALGSRTPFLAI